MHDGFGAFESALRCFDLLTGNFGADLMSLEFLQTGHHNFGEVGLLEAVRNLYGFIQFAFAECARNGRSELPRLLTSRAVGHEAVDHDADGIGGHDKQADNDGFGQGTHLLPKGCRIPTYRAAFLKKVQRPDLQLQKHRFFFSPAS